MFSLIDGSRIVSRSASPFSITDLTADSWDWVVCWIVYKGTKEALDIVKGLYDSLNMIAFVILITNSEHVSSLLNKK